MGIFDFLRRKPAVSNKTLPTESVLPEYSFTSQEDDSCDQTINHNILYKKCLEKANPSNRGLYPHEILLLEYANSYSQKENLFQGFWLHGYHVENPQEILISLENRGFIKPSDLEFTLKHETVANIKEELKHYGLKVSGKKDDLVHRLMSEGSFEELDKKYSVRRYQLTDIGMVELKENEYILYIHRHKNLDLDIWNLNILMSKNPDRHYREVIWSFLDKAGSKHIENKNYGLYRNVRFHMSEFLVEEKKYETALQLMAEVVYFDLSGVHNGYTSEIEKYITNSLVESYFPYESSSVTVAPGILRRLKTLRDALDLTDEDLYCLLIKEFSSLKTFRQIFSNKECADIVLAEIHEDKETLTNIYLKAEQRYRNQL